MSLVIEQIPVILIWVSIWGLIDLAIQVLVPKFSLHRALTYLFILAIAIYIDIKTPGGYF